MDNDTDNISIKIHISFDDHITSEFLVNTVSSIERAIYKQEKLLLKKLRKEFSDFPEIYFDAAEFRLQNSKGKTLHIKSATEGSIILFGIAFGINYWLLNITMGETVKEAWLESESHKKLKQYLKTNLFNKSERIKNSINSELNNKNISSGIQSSGDEDNIQLDIYVGSKNKTSANKSLNTDAQ